MCVHVFFSPFVGCVAVNTCSTIISKLGGNTTDKFSVMSFINIGSSDQMRMGTS